MSKSSRILIGIVITLGLIYAIQRLTSANSTVVSLKPFSKIDTSKITGISIGVASEIAIKRNAGTWEVTSPVDARASSGQVSILLTRIAADPSATVVADNLSDSSAYGLVASAPELKLTEADGRSMRLKVGDVTPDYSGCYVQVDGNARVLELSSNIRTIVAQGLTDWRDKVIFGTQVSDIADIAAADFSVGDTLYHFFRSDTLWKVNGVDVPATNARAIIESLIGTEAIDFVDTATHIEKHILDYGITLKDRQHFAGTLFTVSGQTCLTNSANNKTYVVSSLLPQTLEQALRSIHKTYLTRVRS